MALSPYRNKSSVCRSRSTSFSSPNSRSFQYQEVLTAGENALIRSFSYGQFFTKGKCGETLESTQVRITNFISPIKSVNVNKMVKKKTKKPKGEAKINQAELSIEFKGDEKTSWKIFSLANIKYLNLFILIIFCASFLYKYHYCNLDWNTQELSIKLKETVFGQDKAIMELTYNLKNFCYAKKNTVISFVGSVGVGKTLVANIIHDSFPWKVNKHLHFFNSNSKKMLSGKTYSPCGANLIIIDDLNTENLKKALDEVEKIYFTNINLLIILLIQSHNQNESKVIFETLNCSNVKITNLVFNDLNHNDVKKCFQVELFRQGKYLPDRNLNKIVNEHMKYCNISKSYLGCKNVLNEVSLLEGKI